MINPKKRFRRQLWSEWNDWNTWVAEYIVQNVMATRPMANGCVVTIAAHEFPLLSVPMSGKKSACCYQVVPICFTFVTVEGSFLKKILMLNHIQKYSKLILWKVVFELFESKTRLHVDSFSTTILTGEKQSFPQKFTWNEKLPSPKNEYQENYLKQLNRMDHWRATDL